MRVHGNTTIKRRSYSRPISQQDAREMLEEDFRGLCGYCGKNGRRLRQRFHVDHFVPQFIDKERIEDYSNFVWACPKCNRIKSKKWPTKDKKTAHTEDIGFIDPASEEFDEHLFRDDTGNIQGKTPLGTQICKLLNFHLRPTALFWKVEQLCIQKEQLQAKFQNGALSREECEFYVELDMVLGRILDALYLDRE